MKTSSTRITGLVKALDIIARDLGGIEEIGPWLPGLGAGTLIFWIVSIMVLDLTNIYIDAGVMFSGFLGFTLLFITALLIVYRIGKHIEYSIHYYSQIDDILERVKGRKILGEELENLTLIRRPRISYYPGVLIAGYLSLLFQYDYLIAIMLAAVFSLVNGLYIYDAFKSFNEHYEHEKNLDRKITDLLGIREFKEKIDVRINPLISLVISSLTLSTGLVYYALQYGVIIDIHTSDHRYFHNRVFKPAIMKLLREEEPGETY